MLSGVSRAVRHLIYGTPLYALTLKGSLRAGTVMPAPALRPVGTNEEDPHRFCRLAGRLAMGTDAEQARAWIGNWIENHERWSEPAWRPDILGQRLTQWLAAYEFLCAGADGNFLDALGRSLAAQSKHLHRTAKDAPEDARAFRAVMGLIVCATSLPHAGDLLKTGLYLLSEAINRQVLPDGCHIQRNPSLHLQVLEDLIYIRAALIAARIEVPQVLQGGIDRMAPMLRAFRHGDGGLALFNGGNEEEAPVIDQVLAASGVTARPPSSAPHSGFQRLTAGRIVLIADVGTQEATAIGAHAGTLGFEFSVGKDRLIVNCGDDSHAETDWREAMRATSAHSTLTVDDTNSAHLTPGGGFGKRKPVAVTCTRREQDGNVWLDASHDGYRERFNLIHGRTFYLSADGRDLRGRDTLIGTGGSAYAARFHLHPGVRASLTRDGSTVLLKLPHQGGWRFKAKVDGGGGTVALEDSIYLGGLSGRRRCQQIVVSGVLAGAGADINWSLRPGG